MTAITRRDQFPKCVVLLLIAALTSFSTVAVSAAQAPAPEPQVDAGNRVLGLPTGTRLTLGLNDGSAVTGTLAEKRGDVVVVRLEGRTSLTVSRSRVVTVSVLEVGTTYTAVGEPDADVIRQVIAALGTGKKVELKTTSARAFRGRIQSVEPDGFTLSHGLRSRSEQIAYGQVGQIRPARALTRPQWAAVIGGALGVWTLIGWALVPA